MKRLISLSAVGGVLALALIGAPAAIAADCGPVGPVQGPPVIGSLLLKPNDSTTELNFGSSGGTKRLILTFEVKECTLASKDGIRAKTRASDLPPDPFGTSEEADVSLEDSILTVEIPVQDSDFGSGKFSGSITVDGPFISPLISKFSVQQKSDLWIPVLVAVISILVGVLGAVYVARATIEKKADIKWKLLGFPVFAALVGAGAVLISSYFEASLWVADWQSLLTFFVAATSAAFGGAGGAIAARKIVTEKKA